MKRSIVWFRNDLRIHDNEALFDAVNQNDEIIPVYVFDDRFFDSRGRFGFPKTGKFRCRFIIESIEDLRANLRAYNSELIVARGRAEEIIPEIARQFKTAYVYCNRERTAEELSIQDALENELWHIGQEIRYYRGKMLYYTADLPFPISHCPDSFNHFRKELEKFIPVRKPLEIGFSEIPSPPIEDSGTIPKPKDYGWSDLDTEGELRGGETEALRLTMDYIWNSRAVSSHKQEESKLLSKDHSSRLSAYLAQGCLSPKLLFDELSKYEKEFNKNKSSHQYHLDLMWRDFHRFMAKKHGNSIFKINGIKSAESPPYLDRAELFEKWRTGMTGFPFIDACMRELNNTGFMSNQARLCVSSFLINELKLNWLMGAEYFESMLIDYDPCSNYGNWNIMAGVGLDNKDDHYINVQNKAKRLDPDGAYIKYWIPELKDESLDRIFNPYVEGEAVLHHNKDYPAPCLYLKHWAVS